MSKTLQMTIGGIFSALSFTFMYLSLFMPLTYLWVYLAGFVMMAIAIETGRKTALCAYVVVALLCFMLLPNMARALSFAALIGYYPVIKVRLDNISRAFVRRIAKAAIFAAAAVAEVFVVVQLLGLSVAPGIGQFEHAGAVFTIAVAQRTAFAVAYDYVLGFVHHRYTMSQLKSL